MRILSLAILVLLTNVCLSQETTQYSFFDANWKPAKEKKAVFLVRKQQLSGRSWQVDYYQFKGPLIKTETFSDEKTTIRQGRSSWYNERGTIDSTGTFTNNLRDKSWYYYKGGDSAVMTKMVDYQKGNIVKVTDYTIKDPLATDTTGKDERESEFPGGDQGWIKYLGKVFSYPKRAMELDAQGQVQVMFIINKYGKVEDPFLYKSVELSLDEESIRVIKATPAWIPATKNGEKLNSYKIQPLSFRLTSG